jgi:hypothetical protein
LRNTFWGIRFEKGRHDLLAVTNAVKSVSTRKPGHPAVQFALAFFMARVASSLHYSTYRIGIGQRIVVAGLDRQHGDANLDPKLPNRQGAKNANKMAHSGDNRGNL